MQLTRLKAIVLCLFAATFATSAKANDALVVYIECTKDGVTSQGSGVLVSKDGHVLTARHVVPEGATCQASIGNNLIPKRGIRKSFKTHQIKSAFDATLMEFARNTGETFDFASVCSVTEALKGKEIIAKGFDEESYGAPDLNDGVLSNTAIDFNGMVQMTAEIINGKSGGPIFLKDTNTIVGIIAGAEFNAQGVVTSYKMLAIDPVLDHVDLLKLAANCDEDLNDQGSSNANPNLPVIEMEREPILRPHRGKETIILEAESNSGSSDMITVCLINETSTPAKRLAIYDGSPPPIRIEARGFKGKDCTQIDKKGGAVKFSTVLPSSATPSAGQTTLSNFYAGKTVTYRWIEN